MRTEEVSALVVDVCERVILPRFRTLERHQVQQKKPGDLVTVADREAEAELTDAFHRATPGALVVGEEASFTRPELVRGLASADHAWVIDPVDGTRNFAEGRDDFGVMVAEVRGGVTVRGWIWQPRHEQLFVAERGAGAQLNGIRLSAPPAPRDPARVGGGRRLQETSIPGVEWRWTRGSCAVDYPDVALGRIEGLAYRSLHPWDHLAGALLVAEVGGVARLDRAPYAAGVHGEVLVVAAHEETARRVELGLGRTGRR